MSKLSWSFLSLSQQSAFKGAEPEWDALSEQAQHNYWAISHALEATKQPGSSGLSCLWWVQPHSAVMREDCREVNLGWFQGAEAGLKRAGFVYRVGSPTAHHGESGLIWTPEGGHADIQGIHVLFNNADAGRGDVHIDYDWGIGHFAQRNDDVVRNMDKFEKWFGPFPAAQSVFNFT